MFCTCSIFIACFWITLTPTVEFMNGTANYFIKNHIESIPFNSEFFHSAFKFTPAKQPKAVRQDCSEGPSFFPLLLVSKSAGQSTSLKSSQKVVLTIWLCFLMKLGIRVGTERRMQRSVRSDFSDDCNNRYSPILLIWPPYCPSWQKNPQGGPHQGTFKVEGWDNTFLPAGG